MSFSRRIIFSIKWEDHPKYVFIHAQIYLSVLYIIITAPEGQSQANACFLLAPSSSNVLLLRNRNRWAKPKSAVVRSDENKEIKLGR